MQNPQMQYVVGQQQMAGSIQTQTVIVQPPVQPGIYQNYNSKQSKALGAIQVITGILCFIIGVVQLFIALPLLWSFTGQGVWCGILFMVSGSFGIQASKSKTTCTILTYMILSIISSIAAGSMLVLSAIAVDTYSYCSIYGCRGLAGFIYSLIWLLLLLGIVDGFTAIWSAIICCKAICCGHQLTQAVQASAPIVHYGGQPGQQIVYITPAQSAFVQPQRLGNIQQVDMNAASGQVPPPEYSSQQQQQTPYSHYKS